MSAQPLSPEGVYSSDPDVLAAEAHLIVTDALAGLALVNPEDKDKIECFTRQALEVTLMPEEARAAYVARVARDHGGSSVLLRLACDICIGSWAQPRLDTGQIIYVLQYVLGLATEVHGHRDKAWEELEELMIWMWNANHTQSVLFKDYPQFTISADRVRELAQQLGVNLPEHKQSLLAQVSLQHTMMNDRIKDIHTGV